MITSLEQKSFLSEILDWEPIPEDKLIYFRERLKHKLHAAILDAFLERSKGRDLKQSDLAARIHRKRAQITRWFSSASNLTLDSISDLMVGLGMDFDGFPFTPIEKTVEVAEREARNAEEEARIKNISDNLIKCLFPSLVAQTRQITLAIPQEKEQESSTVSIGQLASPPTGEAHAFQISERRRTGENRRFLFGEGEHYA